MRFHTTCRLDGLYDLILTIGNHAIFVQIFRSDINLAIIPLQGVGKDIVAEFGEIAEFLEHRVLGDNWAEVKDTAGPIIEDNLDLVAVHITCLGNL